MRDPTKLVEEFLSAGNRFDVDSQMMLLHDDIQIEVPGIGLVSGCEAARGFLSFDIGLNRQTTLVECRHSDDIVWCDAVRRDDWLTTVGIGELETTYEFRVIDGAIRSISGTFSPHSAELMGKTLEDFIPWALEAHPELFRADGGFKLNRENGERLVVAIREWTELR